MLGQGGLPGVDLQAAPLDGKTKLALQAAVALMAVGGGVFGARPHASSDTILRHGIMATQCLPCGLTWHVAVQRVIAYMDAQHQEPQVGGYGGHQRRARLQASRSNYIASQQRGIRDF